MNRFFACALFIGLAAYAAATHFEDCGSTAGEVSAVEVTDCPDGQDVCVLKKGTKPIITIKFKSKADSKSLNTVVHGVIADVPVPFPLPQPDACKTGVTCPVKSGESYVYSNGFDVRRSYPSIKVGVRFELQGENNVDIACVEIPSKIE